MAIYCLTAPPSGRYAGFGGGFLYRPAATKAWRLLSHHDRISSYPTPCQRASPAGEPVAFLEEPLAPTDLILPTFPISSVALLAYCGAGGSAPGVHSYLHHHS